jgi:hypothetical protein
MVQPVVKSPTHYGIGEVVELPFIRVVFQCGLPKDAGLNGCRIEDVIDVALFKLDQYQREPLACEENAEAIRYLKLAKQSLAQRIQRRQVQGVLNTMTRHEPIRTEDENEDFSATGA